MLIVTKCSCLPVCPPQDAHLPKLSYFLGTCHSAPPMPFSQAVGEKIPMSFCLQQVYLMGEAAVVLFFWMAGAILCCCHAQKSFVMHMCCHV